MTFARKIKLLGGIIAIITLLTAIGVIWAYSPAPYHIVDRYHLSLPVDSIKLSQCLAHERQRVELVQGLTVDQIRERFRGIPIGNPPNDYQKSYPEPDILWIADTPFAIQIKEGKGDHIRLLKG